MRMTFKDKTLIVLTGPTAVGKTDLSVNIAYKLNSEIISADARQFYKELKIGTAAPDISHLQKVKHHFVGHLSIFDYYNVSLFEQKALKVLEGIFQKTDYVVLTGGSGLYIDTLCHGIDHLPDAEPEVRQRIKQVYTKEGIEGIRQWIKQIDPVYYRQVDLGNPNRIKRGIEVFLSTGIPFSELRKQQYKERPFRIKRIIINRDRDELFDRINRRVDLMVKQGLIEEAIGFFKYRHLNALNTVGYKELFSWMSGCHDLKYALEKIKTNSRRYAKRQLTWFKRYEDARWFHPDQQQDIMGFIRQKS